MEVKGVNDENSIGNLNSIKPLINVGLKTPSKMGQKKNIPSKPQAIVEKSDEFFILRSGRKNGAAMKELNDINEQLSRTDVSWEAREVAINKWISIIECKTVDLKSSQYIKFLQRTLGKIALLFNEQRSYQIANRASALLCLLAETSKENLITSDMILISTLLRQSYSLNKIIATAAEIALISIFSHAHNDSLLLLLNDTAQTSLNENFGNKIASLLKSSIAKWPVSLIDELHPTIFSLFTALLSAKWPSVRRSACLAFHEYESRFTSRAVEFLKISSPTLNKRLKFSEQVNKEAKEVVFNKFPSSSSEKEVVNVKNPNRNSLTPSAFKSASVGSPERSKTCVKNVRPPTQVDVSSSRLQKFIEWKKKKEASSLEEKELRITSKIEDKEEAEKALSHLSQRHGFMRSPTLQACLPTGEEEFSESDDLKTIEPKNLFEDLIYSPLVSPSSTKQEKEESQESKLVSTAFASELNEFLLHSHGGSEKDSSSGRWRQRNERGSATNAPPPSPAISLIPSFFAAAKNEEAFTASLPPPPPCSPSINLLHSPLFVKHNLIENSMSLPILSFDEEEDEDDEDEIKQMQQRTDIIEKEDYNNHDNQKEENKVEADMTTEEIKDDIVREEEDGEIVKSPYKIEGHGAVFFSPNSNVDKSQRSESGKKQERYMSWKDIVDTWEKDKVEGGIIKKEENIKVAHVEKKCPNFGNVLIVMLITFFSSGTVLLGRNYFNAENEMPIIPLSVNHAEILPLNFDSTDVTAASTLNFEAEIEFVSSPIDDTVASIGEVSNTIPLITSVSVCLPSPVIENILISFPPSTTSSAFKNMILSSPEMIKNDQLEIEKPIYITHFLDPISLIQKDEIGHIQSQMEAMGIIQDEGAVSIQVELDSASRAVQAGVEEHIQEEVVVTIPYQEFDSVEAIEGNSLIPPADVMDLVSAPVVEEIQIMVPSNQANEVGIVTSPPFLGGFYTVILFIVTLLGYFHFFATSSGTPPTLQWRVNSTSETPVQEEFEEGPLFQDEYEEPESEVQSDGGEYTHREMQSPDYQPALGWVEFKPSSTSSKRKTSIVQSKILAGKSLNSNSSDQSSETFGRYTAMELMHEIGSPVVSAANVRRSRRLNVKSPKQVTPAKKGGKVEHILFDAESASTNKPRSSKKIQF